jgi:hypothetical protein
MSLAKDEKLGLVFGFVPSVVWVFWKNAAMPFAMLRISPPESAFLFFIGWLFHNV